MTFPAAPKAGEFKGIVVPTSAAGATITVVSSLTHIKLLKGLGHELINVGLVVNSVKSARLKGGQGALASKVVEILPAAQSVRKISSVW